jgi:hypothetical protein
VIQGWRDKLSALMRRMDGLRHGLARLSKAGKDQEAPARHRRAPTARKGLRWPKARWIMAVAGLAALSVAVSAWLHGGRFGVSKPAAQQPVKDVRSGAERSGTSAAVDLIRQSIQARESRT